MLINKDLAIEFFKTWVPNFNPERLKPDAGSLYFTGSAIDTSWQNFKDAVDSGKKYLRFAFVQVSPTNNAAGSQRLIFLTNGIYTGTNYLASKISYYSDVMETQSAAVALGRTENYSRYAVFTDLAGTSVSQAGVSWFGWKYEIFE